MKMSAQSNSQTQIHVVHRVFCVDISSSMQCRSWSISFIRPEIDIGGIRLLLAWKKQYFFIYLNISCCLAGISPHQCRFCQKIFTRKEHLNNHEMIHTGISPHKCEFCNKVSVLVVHPSLIYTKLIRILNFQTFTRKEHLTNHLKHHSGDNPHVCTICNKPFTRKEHLINHMR